MFFFGKVLLYLELVVFELKKKLFKLHLISFQSFSDLFGASARRWPSLYLARLPEHQLIKISLVETSIVPVPATPDDFHTNSEAKEVDAPNDLQDHTDSEAKEVETKNKMVSDASSLPSSRCSIGGSDVSSDLSRCVKFQLETLRMFWERRKM